MGGFESNSVNAYITFIRIYIPIWVDLKDGSNLVILVFALWFTFQYGWIWKPLPLPLWFQPDFIYIPIWVDLKGVFSTFDLDLPALFTFQYGWIWKSKISELLCTARQIYIPIWVDLKVRLAQRRLASCRYLHSNMGGFESGDAVHLQQRVYKFTFQYGWIWKP